MHAHMKSTDGEDVSLGYCPLDLYSGDEARVTKAIHALWDAWIGTSGGVNNLRVFVGGSLLRPSSLVSLSYVRFPSSQLIVLHSLSHSPHLHANFSAQRTRSLLSKIYAMHSPPPSSPPSCNRLSSRNFPTSNEPSMRSTSKDSPHSGPRHNLPQTSKSKPHSAPHLARCCMYLPLDRVYQTRRWLTGKRSSTSISRSTRRCRTTIPMRRTWSTTVLPTCCQPPSRTARLSSRLHQMLTRAST